MKALQGIPDQAHKILADLTYKLFSTFYLQPEEMFLRGHHDAALKRIDRIRTALEFEDLDEGELEKRLADWRRRVKEAYTALLVRDEPSGEGQGQRLVGGGSVSAESLDSGERGAAERHAEENPGAHHSHRFQRSSRGAGEVPGGLIVA